MKVVYVAKVNDGTFEKGKNGKTQDINILASLFFPTKGPNGEQGSAGIPGPFGPRVSNKT